MLTPTAARSAHRAAVSATTLTGAGAAAVRSLPLAIRQRRHSSSKHSSTPKQTSAPPTSAPKQSGSGASKKKSAKSKGSKENTEAKQQQATEPPAENGVQPPSVPSTAHVDPKTVYLASLFAQHRPLSLHQPVPTNDNQRSFDAIFASRSSKQRTQDVIFTLASAVKHLESAAGGQGGLENGMHSQPQALNLEDLAKTFRPFNAPPPPVPMDPAYAEPATEQNTSTAAVSFGIEELPMPEGAAAEIMETPTGNSLVRRPFRERMRARQETWLSKWVRQLREQWNLISVKRQRKAKMKKHKYKKLMKRTRNLRRRLDRL